ncbi:hypothetical protein AS181_18955 [Gordonia sp. SGD-V-85]|nr:hypothetical protein AS181_18955 [Gordonia sp. SGD-V-85]
MPEDLELPSARCEAGQPWHWMCTFAHTTPVTAQPGPRMRSSRTDHADLQRLATSVPSTVSDTRGPHRKRMIPAVATVTATATWRAVGDSQRLQGRISSIPNVVIVPMLGKNAIAGLRDQVLGTGPGTQKNNVRTGGVDSSWVRDAVSHAGQDPPYGLVFFTDNHSDVEETLREMEIRVADADGNDGVRVCGPAERALFDLVAWAKPADGPVRLALATYFATQITRQRRDAREDFHDGLLLPEWASIISDISVGGCSRGRRLRAP